MQGGHCSFEMAFQVVRRVFGQVFHLSSQSCKAFALCRRPQGDPKVSSELQWGAEGVTLAIAFNTVSTSLHRIVHLPSPISHLLIREYNCGMIAV